jgi:hypothetical protein
VDPGSLQETPANVRRPGPSPLQAERVSKVATSPPVPTPKTKVKAGTAVKVGSTVVRARAIVIGSAFAMSCSTARSSTLCARPRSSSRAGDQHDRTARLNRIQATSTRGVRACIRRVAGCATPTGSAGHAGATANLKLTFQLDHSAGADHPAVGALTLSR